MFGGRDIGAGHLRGWGLEYGELYEKHLAADPIFAAAFNAAKDRGSLLTLHKLCNLYLIIRYAMAEDHGDIFEFGSFSGGSAVFMATILKQLGRKASVLAFDTFAGMPPTDAVRDMHSEGDFNKTGYAELLEYIRSKGLGAHLRTVQGTFDETLPGVLEDNGTIGMIHVDCDIYEPIKFVVRACLPHMPAQTHVAFDDPLHGSCLGAFDAVQELMIRELDLTAEQAYPHLVFRSP
ncbi:MAG: class I SAM-dependent methyltransferase [Pseudoxanthomonas sp.]